MTKITREVLLGVSIAIGNTADAESIWSAIIDLVDICDSKIIHAIRFLTYPIISLAVVLVNYHPLKIMFREYSTLGSYGVYAAMYGHDRWEELTQTMLDQCNCALTAINYVQLLAILSGKASSFTQDAKTL
ncbi:uncharacterized protein TRIADDRAFT_57392 [Trichoplax adhaerens]|uniref:Uncharacterized protein n=1 Tax=Trichoplax adhaerens TaxID=10228 RepID=B3RZB5_TRIAD|nr:predicted protein [Trichoplax adhaerens]EDV24174.1 predicted protein [Trichoplax adhaerens]|eukprot:XP_002113700.1 predicted protein [Trichoplax adhaerens]